MYYLLQLKSDLLWFTPNTNIIFHLNLLVCNLRNYGIPYWAHVPFAEHPCFTEAFNGGTFSGIQNSMAGVANQSDQKSHFLLCYCNEPHHKTYNFELESNIMWNMLSVAQHCAKLLHYNSRQVICSINSSSLCSVNSSMFCFTFSIAFSVITSTYTSICMRTCVAWIRSLSICSCANHKARFLHTTQ